MYSVNCVARSANANSMRAPSIVSSTQVNALYRTDDDRQTFRVASENPSNPCEKTILYEIVGKPESISDNSITPDSNSSCNSFPIADSAPKVAGACRFDTVSKNASITATATEFAWHRMARNPVDSMQNMHTMQKVSLAEVASLSGFTQFS